MINVKEAVAQPRTVALYAALDLTDYYTAMPVPYLNYDEHYAPLPEGSKREKSYDKFVRVSEPIELVFQPLANDSIVQKAVESIDEAERGLREELNKKIAALRERRSQLLALTHQSETA